MAKQTPQWDLKQLKKRLKQAKITVHKIKRIQHGKQFHFSYGLKICWYEKSGRTVVQGRPSPQFDHLAAIVNEAFDRFD